MQVLRIIVEPIRTYSLTDLLSAGFAIFSLKDPSLLAFRQQFARRSENLKRIYGIEQIAEDSALREGLDGVDPSVLQAQFKPLVDQLRLKKVFEKRQALGAYTVFGSRWNAAFLFFRSLLPQLPDQKAP